MREALRDESVHRPGQLVDHPLGRLAARRTPRRRSRPNPSCRASPCRAQPLEVLADRRGSARPRPLSRSLRKRGLRRCAEKSSILRASVFRVNSGAAKIAAVGTATGGTRTTYQAVRQRRAARAGLPIALHPGGAAEEEEGNVGPQPPAEGRAARRGPRPVPHRRLSARSDGRGVRAAAAQPAAHRECACRSRCRRRGACRTRALRSARRAHDEVLSAARPAGRSRGGSRRRRARANRSAVAASIRVKTLCSRW